MSTIKSSSEDLTLDADGGSSEIKLKINNVEKASISSAGAFTSTTIDATKLTGNLPAISGASLTSLPSHSGNVAFPATQVASADANTLDDYEEGTWTPDVVNNTSSSTWSSQDGNYIKIGSFVSAWGRCDAGNSGTAGTTLILTGLPFAHPGTTRTTGIWGTNGTTARTGNILNAQFYTGGSNVTEQASFASFALTYWV